MVMVSRSKKWSNWAVILIGCIVIALSGSLFAQTSRWAGDRAQTWYEQQPWLVGSNYIPEDAINQLEMWQSQTFDAAQIDKELGWAENMGMNTMRVFLHDLVWQEDAAGLKKRLDQFLEGSPRHPIQ